MSTNVSYPSELVPAPPAIHLSIPDSWEQVMVPEALLAVRESNPPQGEFATNIVVRYLRRAPGTTETQILGEIKEYAESKPQGTSSEPYEVTLNDRVYVADNIAYVDEQAGSLGQMHLFTGAASAAQMGIVQVTASFSGARTDEAVEQVKEILGSLRVGGE